MNKLILILAFLLSCSISNAGTIDANVPDSQYIEYGKKHQCITKLEGVYPVKEQEMYFYASAIVFKPRWILTAAHVVKDAKQCRIVVEKQVDKISKIIPHPLYEEKKFGKYDIALGYLQDEVKLDFYPELYTKNDEVGKLCSMSGYGITGIFQGSERKVDNNRRAGSNIIDSTDQDLLICSLKHGPRTRLEFLICHGDSGGGLFIDKKLAGINSCIFTEHKDKKLDANMDDYSGHTRVSLFIKWINDTISGVEKNDP